MAQEQIDQDIADSFARGEVTREIALLLQIARSMNRLDAVFEGASGEGNLGEGIGSAQLSEDKKKAFLKLVGRSR